MPQTTKKERPEPRRLTKWAKEQISAAFTGEPAEVPAPIVPPISPVVTPGLTPTQVGEAVAGPALFPPSPTAPVTPRPGMGMMQAALGAAPGGKPGPVGGKPADKVEPSPEVKKATTIGNIFSSIGKVMTILDPKGETGEAMKEAGVPEMLARMGIAFGTSPGGVLSAGARVGQQFLGAQEAQVARGLAEREIATREETAAAATLRAETGAMELELEPVRKAAAKEEALEKQRKQVELSELRRDVHNLLLHKTAHDTLQKTFTMIGEGGIPKEIPVSWGPEEEERLAYSLALGQAEHGVDLSLYPPESDVQKEAFLQSTIDRGLKEGLTPDEAEAAAFNRLIELGY